MTCGPGLGRVLMFGVIAGLLGFSDSIEARTSLQSEENYRAFGAANRLAKRAPIGVSRDEGAEARAGQGTRRAAPNYPGLGRMAVVFSLVVAPLLALGVGLYLFQHSRETLHAITSTLSEVSRGRFDARIPAEASRGSGEVAIEINALLDHLQNLTQSLNHASAEIAHTLKRPLIGLRRRLENAREGRLDRAQFMEVIDASIAEVDSMVGMFEAILDIAQIEAGDFRSRFMEVDLRSILLKLVDVYEAVIQDSGHKLVVDLDGHIEAKISGAPNLLFQMFNNLVENAILYCPVGTTITISLKAGGDGYVATVADDGPGLSAEDRKNVFRPFFRPESTRGTPGHGLGIPFVAAIVRLHRARFVLEDNAPGLRASVYFSAARAKKSNRVTADAESARGFKPYPSGP